MSRSIAAFVGVVLAGVLSVGLAQGMTLAQAQKAEFNCLDVGDGLGHCLNTRSGKAKSTNVLVFGSMDADATLIATEILLSPSVYHGQPCPSEGLEEWLDVGFARACHHYVGPR